MVAQGLGNDPISGFFKTIGVTEVGTGDSHAFLSSLFIIPVGTCLVCWYLLSSSFS